MCSSDLDLQVGLASLTKEVRRFGPYLANADVHLGLDPEFAMAASGRPPGKVIGTLDAEQVNEVIAWLSEIVRANRLPPKVLVLHRFTSKMLTNARDIRATPEVQVVVNMDGWGPPQLKLDTYRQIVAPEAVQFTGFKIFYIQDMLPPSTALVDPATILALKPVPAYIQYQ